MNATPEEKLLVDKAKSIIRKIDKWNEESTTKEFLDLNIYKSRLAVEEMVSFIVEMAFQQPQFSEVYARVCSKQVTYELANNKNVSNFAKELQAQSKSTAAKTQAQREFVKIEREKKAEIASEKDEKIKKDKQIDLLKEQYKIAKKRFDDTQFIGHLFLHSLIPKGVILNYSMHLLASVTDKPDKSIGGYPADEVSIERAVSLFETIGQVLDEQNKEIEAATAAALAAPTPPRQLQMQFPLDRTFEVLGDAVKMVDGKLSTRIKRLLERRANGWVAKENVEDLAAFERSCIVECGGNEAEKASIALEKASIAIEKAALAIEKASVATRKGSISTEKVSIATIEVEKAAVENADLRKAIEDMQTAMEAMRAAMATLGERNKAVTEGTTN